MPLAYYPPLFALGLVILIQASPEIGFRLGRRRATGVDKPAEAIVTTVLSATLGLLGLLLGFSFAGAGGRFIDRADVIVKEANALGTAYLRTDLLGEPYRSDCRKALRDYTARRIELFREFEPERTAPIRAQCEELQGAFWKPATDGVRAAGKYDQTVLPPLNDVIDLHTTRLAMEHRHTPPFVIGILAACTGLVLATLGYGCGLRGRRHWGFTTSLGLLLGIALWLVLDLDYPRAGLIRIGQGPMIATLESMNANP